jgi:hypothetical protein
MVSGVDLDPAVSKADPEYLLGCTVFQTACWYPPLLKLACVSTEFSCEQSFRRSA